VLIDPERILTSKGFYMMSASLLSQQQPFGLFELDPAGTVLYSRIEPDGDGARGATDVAGRDFFEEVAPFANVEELRRRVLDFTCGSGQADSFDFTCCLEKGEMPVRVLLARVRERSGGNRTKSVLLHIRKV
jgi:hypothetical protein